MWAYLFLAIFFTSMLFLVYLVLEWAFIDWYREWRVHREEKLFMAGYQYAHDLYKVYQGSTVVIVSLRRSVEYNEENGFDGPWDRGVEQALFEIEKDFTLAAS